MAQGGVAQRFWLRVERERVAKGWSASRLSTETARHTPSGKPIPRSTIDNLKASTRAPQPYIVQALTSALGIDYEEGATLAGLLPARGDSVPPDVHQAIQDSPVLTDEQKRVVSGVIEQFLAVNQAQLVARRRRPSADTGRTDDERKAI